MTPPRCLGSVCPCTSSRVPRAHADGRGRPAPSPSHDLHSFEGSGISEAAVFRGPGYIAAGRRRRYRKRYMRHPSRYKMPSLEPSTDASTSELPPLLVRSDAGRGRERE